jgi:hypothetical protein
MYGVKMLWNERLNNIENKLDQLLEKENENAVKFNSIKTNNLKTKIYLEQLGSMINPELILDKWKEHLKKIEIMLLEVKGLVSMGRTIVAKKDQPIL